MIGTAITPRPFTELAGEAGAVIKALDTLDAPLIRYADKQAPLTCCTIRGLALDRSGALCSQAIQVENALHLLIDGVEIYGYNSGGAVSISALIGYATPSEDVTVINCNVRESGVYGIVFGNVTGGLAENNIGTDCYREVLGVEPVVGWAKDIAIRNNEMVSGVEAVAGSQTGIFVITESSGGWIDNVEAYGNYISASANIPGDINGGMTILGGSRVHIHHNTIERTSGGGVRIGNIEHRTEGVLLEYNTITDCNQSQNISPHGAGVSLRNAFGCTVRNNTISGSLLTHTVEETWGASGNVISPN